MMSFNALKRSPCFFVYGLGVVALLVTTQTVPRGSMGRKSTLRFLQLEERVNIKKSSGVVVNDARPLCAGPRHQLDSTREPFYEKAKYGLLLGVNYQSGQTNNLIFEFVNAVDVAMDSDGHTVVVLSDWATKFLEEFIGVDPVSWDQFTRDFPVVSKEYSPSSASSNLIAWEEETWSLLVRSTERTKEKSSWETTQSRRVHLLRYLFSSLKGESCDFLTQTKEYLQSKFNQTKYVAVHVRDMDGDCEYFTKNPFNKESCAMSPSYVKDILEMNGHDTGLPIVIMSDMHDEEKVQKLQNELEKVVVPKWDFDAKPSMIADMVLGAASEVFIGIQGSTGSRNIGILREGFGKDVSTNYVFMTKTEEGNWTSFYAHHAYDLAFEADH